MKKKNGFCGTEGTSRNRKMLRVVSAAIRGSARALTSVSAKSTEYRIPLILSKPKVTAAVDSQARYFSNSCSTSLNQKTQTCSATLSGTFSNFLKAEAPITTIPVRTLTKYTRYKGKRQSVKAVIDRFYRLDWGMWIRTKAGRHKRLWKKSWKRKIRSRRHVFTNATQSHLLDTMVTKYWRRPKYYVDDPYNPYHKREEFFLTRTKPRLI